ncbi:Parasporal protein [Sporosarcina sp. P3]|uniref:S-layer homology domain-containing protein n=1 Tax=Sporosarcina sp. P3 TaxID=2048245 RepID=UPI000C1675E1|nr:S-layer homology domain-containing protein [Sporosarcina sp. P3]PID21132.1 Parasporal protein [Sporosarcina sp. P3]
MKKKLLGGLSTLLLACSLPLSAAHAESSQPFMDVPATKHFAEAVNDLAKRHIIGGYPDGTFKPGNSITRGQAAAIIVKMTGLATENVRDPKFTDVSTANGYYKAIAAMAEKGMIGGYADGRYGPNDPITRGQMASILVRAFDLPRYDEVENPFKDIGSKYSSSHYASILVIYKLGITTGTTPNTFGLGEPITRGQAAKMLKATEEARPDLFTVKASDLGWNTVRNKTGFIGKDNPFRVIFVKGKEGYSEDQLQIVPEKEGTGYLVVQGADEKQYGKYVVHVKKQEGKLIVTLEKTEHILPTVTSLYIMGDEINQLQHLSLSTMDGKLVSDNVKFKQVGVSTSDQRAQIDFTVNQPGQFIMTAKFTDGKEVRYGVEVMEKKSSFEYYVKVLREQLTATYDLKKHAIGNHKILTKNYEHLVEITRDVKTNQFHAKIAGDGDVSVELEFSQSIYQEDSYKQTGLRIQVQHIGDIRNVQIGEIGHYTDAA